MAPQAATALQPVAFLGGELGRVAGEDGHAGVRAVDGDDPVRVVERQVPADVAADVPARSAEPLVAEGRHQLRPQAGDRDGVQGRPRGPVGVPEARHVGDDDVEGVLRVATVRAGVGEQRENLGVAPEGVRPAVAQDQRHRGPGRVDGPGVDGVDPEAVEVDPDVREPVESRLLGRPVELVGPVRHQARGGRRRRSRATTRRPPAASGHRVARRRMRRSSRAAGSLWRVMGSTRGPWSGTPSP